MKLSPDEIRKLLQSSNEEIDEKQLLESGCSILDLKDQLDIYIPGCGEHYIVNIQRNKDNHYKFKIV